MDDISSNDNTIHNAFMLNNQSNEYDSDNTYFEAEHSNNINKEEVNNNESSVETYFDDISYNKNEIITNINSSNHAQYPDSFCDKSINLSLKFPVDSLPSLLSTTSLDFLKNSNKSIDISENLSDRLIEYTATESANTNITDINSKYFYLSFLDNLIFYILHWYDGIYMFGCIYNSQ